MIDLNDVINNWKTIKEYASECNLTYEAIRYKVVRYKKELEGHIVKFNRKQYLDKYAIEFLEQKRDKKTYSYQLREDYCTIRNILSEKDRIIDKQTIVLEEVELILNTYIEKIKTLEKLIDAKEETIEILKNENIELKNKLEAKSKFWGLK